ncbi:MAG: DUF423 domain-containing protein [Alteromonadaceae bacterium]|nr:DUF423 domain-containing protein [Alteromonadaceae bacterium]
MNEIIKFLLVFVGISGCFSVLFGAWLAHGGQSLSVNAQLILSKALQYQFIHTLALLMTLVWYICRPAKWLVSAAISFVVGILCFSGSLYVKTIFDFALIGKLAPLGGISFALGWLLLALAGKTATIGTTKL